MNKHLRTVAVGILSIAAGSSSLSAAPLYYNSTANPGWSGANAWSTTTLGPTYSTWVPSSGAVFESSGAQTVAIGGNFALSSLTNSTSNVITFQKTSGVSDALTFSGGTINGNFTFSTRSNISGDVDVQSGSITLGGTTITAYAGNLTVSGGSVYVSQPLVLGSASNVTVAGGTFRVGMANTGSTSMGSAVVNSGFFDLGRGTTVDTTALTVSSLSGSGGTVRANLVNSGVVAHSLIVNQSTNTTYSGTIDGTNGQAVISLTKSGSGDLALSGTVTEMVRTTTVSGGRLYVNSSSTSFGDSVGSTAISVASGGTLGGTGTITTLSGDNVVVASGGSLTAGLAASAGKTTYAMGSSAALDISAGTGGTGWIKFELGALTTPGTSYDQIIVSSGSLEIGSGLLNYADFDFAVLSGFGNGQYVLFDAAALSGTLAATGLSGTLDGRTATLALSGSDIVLNVVPEPSVVGMLALSFGAFIILQRARRRRLS